MRRSTDRILTTHVGALPYPTDVWGRSGPDEAKMQAAAAEIVARQRRIGIDIVNEGEVTKGGNWVTFINDRLTGFEATPTVGTLQLMSRSKDWQDFPGYYKDAVEGGTLFEQTRRAPDQTRRVDWSCTAPVTFVGQAALAREISVFQAGLADVAPADAFLTSTAPTSIEAGRLNKHYATQEQFVEAIAEAMRVEYEAIALAGLNVQVDDAWLAALWDRIGIPMGLEAYKRFCHLRVEALNHALRNIPQSQIRYHLCWGSWHGPHASDIALADIVDVLLSVKAQVYLFEAANVRHEHEFMLWDTVKLPEDRILAPGVVTHSTPLVEHPELVAHRIERFAQRVGRERVIASTDCGLGLRCHPEIAWAKLESLAQGADIASRRLWAR
jgi:5-methyltetrahydropteroyltriglutamate--homocysteine methyltransferase